MVTMVGWRMRPRDSVERTKKGLAMDVDFKLGCGQGSWLFSWSEFAEAFALSTIRSLTAPRQVQSDTVLYSSMT
jgi:hypothetical protein